MRLSLCFVAFCATLVMAEDTPKTEKPAPKPEGKVAPKIIPALPLIPRAGAVSKSVTVDRAADVKRAIEMYQTTSTRFLDSVARAKTDQEKADLLKRIPSPVPMCVILGQLVAANAKDDAALDALAVLMKYSDVEAVQKALEGIPLAKDGPKKLDPAQLVLDHHVNSPKLADVLDRLPTNPDTVQFLNAVFAKTLSQEVRAKTGCRLVNLALMEKDDKAAEKLLDQLVADKYMAGIKVGGRSVTVKEWAEGYLLEMRSLKVGEVLPNVKGKTLEGRTKSIADYRGSILVVDVWATWCGPCRAMIPHEREMVARLKDKPFKLLSVSCDEEKETLTEFLEKTTMPWDHWWVGRESEFSKALHITAYPTIYVLDAKGVIRFKNIRGEKLEAAVNGLLDELK